MRQQATELLTDGSVLAQIARTEPLAAVRRIALRNPNLTDVAVLAEVAQKDQDQDTRLEAIRNPRLTDQAVLAEVALHDASHLTRTTAFGRITDQTMLVRYATAPTEPNLDWTEREQALDKVTDPALLVELCVKTPLKSWRARVLKRVTDLDSVMAVMRRAPKEDYVEISRKLDTFTPTDAASTANLVHACLDWHLTQLCHKVIESVGSDTSKTAFLVDIAIGDRSGFAADRALRLLSDDASLLQVATQSQDPRFRAVALARVAAPPAPVANAVLASLLAGEHWDVVHVAWTHAFTLNAENRATLTAVAAARRGFVSNAARAMLATIPARRWAKLSAGSGVKVNDPKSGLGYLPGTLAPGLYAFEVSFSGESYDPTTRSTVSLTSHASRPLSGTLLAGKCYVIDSGMNTLSGKPTWAPSLGPARCD
jgi:hypothetical protein